VFIFYYILCELKNLWVRVETFSNHLKSVSATFCALFSHPPRCALSPSGGDFILCNFIPNQEAEAKLKVNLDNK
jgi:hypothetical protein